MKRQNVVIFHSRSSGYSSLITNRVQEILNAFRVWFTKVLMLLFLCHCSHSGRPHSPREKMNSPESVMLLDSPQACTERPHPALSFMEKVGCPAGLQLFISSQIRLQPQEQKHQSCLSSLPRVLNQQNRFKKKKKKSYRVWRDGSAAESSCYSFSGSVPRTRIRFNSQNPYHNNLPCQFQEFRYPLLASAGGRHARDA